MKPKIAFLVHMLAPYRVSFFTKLFASEGYEWKLFAGFKSKKLDARPQYEGDVAFPVSYHKEIVSRQVVYNKIELEGMLEAVTAFNPDVIIMFAHVGTKTFRDVANWAKASGKKVVMWTAYWEPYYITGYKRVLRDYVIRSFYCKADFHITYSTAAREKLLKIGYPDDQIMIAYNGIDLDLYDTSPVNGERLFEPDAVNFLYCGGFGEDKKVELLIRAMHACLKKGSYKINAYLIGDGPTYNTCKNLIDELRLSNNVKLLGRIKNPDKYIKAADGIVLPGTGGLLLNEAVLFNKPFIVSDADGTEADLLINGFNGLKFAPNDETSLVNAFIEMTENLSYFEANAAQVTRLVTERSNVNAMVATFLRAIRKVRKEKGMDSKTRLEFSKEKAGS